METIIIMIKNLAKELIDDGTNIEYTRGICELIADIDGIPEMHHSERSIEIAIELGLSREAANNLYTYTLKSELIQSSEQLAQLMQEVELPEEANGVICSVIDGLSKFI